MIAYPLLLAFPIAMAFAAANDLFTMRIPNVISLALLAAFAASALWVGMPMDTLLTYLGIGAAVLVVTFILFSMRMLGGGDAKLMAAGAVWMGPEHILFYIAYVTIFGGMLSVAVLIYRKFIPAAQLPLPGWAQRLHTQGTGIPYGIAIAAAGLLMYPSTIWFQALHG